MKEKEKREGENGILDLSSGTMISIHPYAAAFGLLFSPTK